MPMASHAEMKSVCVMTGAGPVQRQASCGCLEFFPLKNLDLNQNVYPALTTLRNKNETD